MEFFSLQGDSRIYFFLDYGCFDYLTYLCIYFLWEKFWIIDFETSTNFSTTSSLFSHLSSWSNYSPILFPSVGQPLSSSSNHSHVFVAKCGVNNYPYHLTKYQMHAYAWGSQHLFATPTIFVNNVVYVLQFPMNLWPISATTCELSFSLTSYPCHSIFHDMQTKQVITLDCEYRNDI